MNKLLIKQLVTDLDSKEKYRMLNTSQNSLPFDCSGSGRILAGQEASAPCQWTCSQRSDGEIQVRCDLAIGALDELRTAAEQAADAPAEWQLEERGLRFEGKTPDGGVLHLDTVDFVLAPNENENDNELVFYVAQTHWQSIDAARVPSHIVFRLVNHEVLAVPSTSATLSSGLVVQGTLVPLQLTSGPAWLRAVTKQSNLIKKLEENGGVAVTTEFLLPISKFEEESTAVAVAHRLCCVLTFLSGNRINWVSYSMVATDGSIVTRGAQNAVTRPYQKRGLINTLSDSRVSSRLTGTGYAPIINRMMERFELQEAKWNLTLIINSFHEAISTDHFAEQQGQLLSNCMEMLRQSFLDHGGNEFVLPLADFEAKQKALLKGVKKLLEENFPDEKGWTPEQCKQHGAKLSQMSTHIKGANRYGFKHVLKEMTDQLGLFSQAVYEGQIEPDPRGFIVPLRLDPTPEEKNAASMSEMRNELSSCLKALVDIRDQLIHRGQFLVPPVDEHKRPTSIEVNEERWKQKRFMERFVAAYLATILGWHQPLPSPPNLHRG